MRGTRLDERGREVVMAVGALVRHRCRMEEGPTNRVIYFIHLVTRVSEMFRGKIERLKSEWN